MKIVVCLIVYLTSLGIACAEYTLSAADMTKSYSKHYLDYDCEYRSWTARVGSQASVEGKLLEYDKKSGKIKLKLKNGKEVSVTESQLVNYNILYLKLNYPNGLALPEFREWKYRDSESKKTITAKLIKSNYVDFANVNNNDSVVIQDTNGSVKSISMGVDTLKYLKGNYPNGFGVELKGVGRRIEIEQNPDFMSWNKSVIRRRFFSFRFAISDGLDNSDDADVSVGVFCGSRSIFENEITVTERSMPDLIRKIDHALNRIAMNPDESFGLLSNGPDSVDLYYRDGSVSFDGHDGGAENRGGYVIGTWWPPKCLFELLIYLRKFNITAWDVEQKKLLGIP